MTATEQFNAAILKGIGQVKKYIADQVNEYDSKTKSKTGRTIDAKRMTLMTQEEGAGAFRHGATIGETTIAGQSYKVQVRIVVTLVPNEETTVDAPKGSYNF